jgi:nitroimidazol reductase NimA-like FMN-containing flavoprotein (pyridoxamine 5'-phosphate oxidase superfamily)
MTDRARDHAGMEILGQSECLRLLWSHHIGRVGFIEGGEPHILPVRYVFHEGKVMFRSAVGAKLDAAVRETPVALEIDGWIEEARTGWSVLVHGTAHWVDDEEQVSTLDALGIEPWVKGNRPLHWVEIRPVEIAGRRIPSG